MYILLVWWKRWCTQILIVERAHLTCISYCSVMWKHQEPTPTAGSTAAKKYIDTFSHTIFLNTHAYYPDMALRSCTIFKHALGDLRTLEHTLGTRRKVAPQFKTNRAKHFRDNHTDYNILAAKLERVYPPCIVLQLHTRVMYVIRRGRVNKRCWNTGMESTGFL